MKNFYKVYTRQVNGENFYFVKKYTSYSDLEGSPRVLDAMGMHKNFYQACKFAKITDGAVIHDLSLQVYIPAKETKEFTLQKVSNTILRSAQHFLAKLRLAGMN